MTRTILFALTGHGELGDSGRPTGVWLEELAAPYQILEAAGFDVLFATPGGVPAPLDPISMAAPELRPAGVWMLDRRDVLARLETPCDLADVDPAQVAAIFLVGGTGTLWDFPESRALAALVTRIHAEGKPVAAICHGVVGLLGATLPDGRPLVAGRALTCFSNAEEVIAGCDSLVPLLAQTALKQQGALYRCAPPFEAMLVEDGSLITGQNPASAPALTEALIRQLGRA